MAEDDAGGGGDGGDELAAEWLDKVGGCDLVKGLGVGSEQHLGWCSGATCLPAPRSRTASFQNASKLLSSFLSALTQR